MTDGIAFERSVAWAAGAGNPAALAELWRRHDGFLRAVVRQLAPTEADAEDWVQDTWCAALRGLSRYRGAASVRTWLYRVAANQARQGLRVNRRQQRLPGVAEPADSHLADQPRSLPGYLVSAVASLPAGQRKVFELHALTGLPHTEVAARLDISVNTSRTQYLRARRKLRGALELSAEWASDDL